MNEIETNTNSNITENNIFIDKYCNICTENIENDKLVTLTCNPTHYFCYTCIFDWYNTIKDNYGNFTFSGIDDNKQCTCPICKKDGGVIPLLPPHTKNITGIHVKGVIPFGVGEVDDSKCDHKYCNNQYQYLSMSKNKLYKKLCSYHYYDFKKGKNITLENDEIFESPYIKCHCKMPNNTECINTNIYNKMYFTTLNNKKYYFCNEHKKLYNDGIQLTLNDDMVANKKSTHKNICYFPNNTFKYGYCLHKLNNDGLCTIEAHNKNKQNIDLDDSDIFGDSNTESEAKKNNSKVMNIHIGLCEAILKNGLGTCKNKGKSEYNGKCGKHKNC